MNPLAIVMPDDVAAEKSLALEALGAYIEKVRPASIVDQKQVAIAFFRFYPSWFLLTNSAVIVCC